MPQACQPGDSFLLLARREAASREVRAHQASQSTLILRQARLTTSLLRAPSNRLNRARFTRRVLVPARQTAAISASALFVSHW